MKLIYNNRNVHGIFPVKHKDRLEKGSSSSITILIKSLKVFL